MVNSAEEAKQEVITSIDSNYEKIKFQLENPYISSEFDLLREEICKCILFDLNQAAITLTNHLFENFFKTMLEFQEGIKVSKENKRIDIGQMFEESVKTYDNINLEKSLNIACSKGIITKEHKGVLKKLKDKYRNPYSHAIKEKIFEDDELIGVHINLKPELGENPFSKPKNYKIKYNPTLHGVFQAIKAKQEAIEYFSQLDEIIRATFKKFYNEL